MLHTYSRPLSFVFPMQHSPLVYIQKKLFRAFLEKEPNYTFPSAQKLAPLIVPNLKPTIEAVKIRHHGDRTSVAVEGENFWFCYNVTVGHHSRRLPSQDITGSSIQFHPWSTAQDQHSHRRQKSPCFSSEPLLQECQSRRSSG